MKYYLCLDLGGTKTSVALFHQNGMMADDFVHVVASRTFKGESAVYDNTKGAVNFILQKTKHTASYPLKANLDHSKRKIHFL